MNNTRLNRKPVNARSIHSLALRACICFKSLKISDMRSSLQFPGKRGTIRYAPGHDQRCAKVEMKLVAPASVGRA